MSKKSKLLETRSFVIKNDKTRIVYDLYLAEENYMDAEVVSVYIAEKDKQPYLMARFLPENVSDGALAANLDIWASMVSTFESLKNK